MHNERKIEQGMIIIKRLLKEEVDEEKSPRVKLALRRSLIELEAAYVSFAEAMFGGTDFSEKEFKEYKAKLIKS